MSGVSSIEGRSAAQPFPLSDETNPALTALRSFFDPVAGRTASRPVSRSGKSHVPELPLAVAYSGGADSTALLLAAAQLWPGQVMALHVHHGLQAAAGQFAETCALVCNQAGIPLHVLRVDARNAPGDSPEDAARRARYGALAAAATGKGARSVLLGQHADDQVETLLLALSRGAGLPGMASMGPRFERHGVAFFRPLLQTPASVLRAWLVGQKVAFTDDPTNTDERFTRNRIRARLLPALADAFPQFRETFARSARHAAQAQTVLSEVAQLDLDAVGSPPDIKRLQRLSGARQANLLRHWLQQQEATPSAAQLDELLGQVAACTTRGHQIRLKVATGHVMRDAEQLVYSRDAGKGLAAS